MSSNVARGLSLFLGSPRDRVIGVVVPLALALANAWWVLAVPDYLGYPAGGSLLLNTLPVLTVALLLRAVAGLGMALSTRVPTLPLALTSLGLFGLSLANGWTYVLCVFAV